MKSPLARTTRTHHSSLITHHVAKRAGLVLLALAAVAMLATVFAWARPDLAQKAFRGPLSSVGKRIFLPEARAGINDLEIENFV